MKDLQIHVSVNNKKGVVNVDYEPNNDVAQSGFDMFNDLEFDVKMCIGYPTLHAYITEFEATGYRRYCGWIQMIKCEYFKLACDTNPSRTQLFIDQVDDYNAPFFAYGYPAELYDAPCNNLSGYGRLVWNAYTYLVEMPTHVTKNTVSFIAGFKWGYIEWDELEKRKISIIPIQKLTYQNWELSIQFLREQFPMYNYR